MNRCFVKLREGAEPTRVAEAIEGNGGSRICLSNYKWDILFDGDDAICALVRAVPDVVSVERSNIIVPLEPVGSPRRTAESDPPVVPARGLDPMEKFLRVVQRLFF